MSPADDQQGPKSPARPATSISESTLLMAVVLMSALGSFGAVRAWYPRERPAPAAPATIQPMHDAAARIARDVDLPVEVERVAAAGRLSIVTDPPGARVEVDGRPHGVSPVAIDGLTAAEHLVTVVSDSGVSQRTITLSKAVTTEAVFSLPKSTAPVPGWVVVASPFPIDVLEHDEVVGTSGTAKIMLAAGKHDVLLRNESVGFEAARTIAVAPGRVTFVEIDPPRGLLNVNARPWADVLIDGEIVGQTPLSNLSVALGLHQVTFRHPQFGERTERIVVTARGVNRVAVDLNEAEARLSEK